MGYKIQSSDSKKLLLVRESVAGSSAFVAVIGSVFLFIGIGLNYFMESWEFPFILFKILFPLFGLIAIWGGIFQPKQVHETVPSRIIFDHEQGAVVVEMRDGVDQKGYIRYDEVDGFDIYEERQSSSSSGRSSRTYYIYHVFLKKKDGGEWHLFKYNSRSAAEEMIGQLKSQIPLTTPFQASVTPKLSNKIEKKEGIDKTIIHWQNKVTWGGPIALLIFSAVFLSILYSFFTFGQELEILFFIVLGFIFSVFLIVMTVTIRKLIKDATTRYAVSVDHKNLEYYEFAKSTGKIKNTKSLPLADVHRINYTFAPSKHYQNAGLKILTREDEKREETYKEKPLEALKDIFKSGNQPITLSITALDPVECLQLENWLQELIMKKSDVKVQ